MVEHVPGIVTYMDVMHLPGRPRRHSTPIYISPQIEEMFGYPREAWVTGDDMWLRVLHPDDVARMRAPRWSAHALPTGSSLSEEYRVVARDGSIVWVSETAAIVRTRPPTRSTGRARWSTSPRASRPRMRSRRASGASSRSSRPPRSVS